MDTDIADRVCDLECVKGYKGTRHEFVGPVKIVLVEPSTVEYLSRAWGAAVLTFAMLLMGATFFIVFAFTLRFTLPFAMNIHILLGTMGLQLFIPSGILMLNALFGGAAPLKLLDRKFQHFYLQICGFGTVVAAGALVFLFEELEYTTHSYAGMIATILSALNILIGPIVCFTSPNKICGQLHRKAHIILGLAAFIMGTICFIYGLWKESFVKWAIIEHFHIIVIFFTVIYSSIVVAAVFLRKFYFAPFE